MASKGINIGLAVDGREAEQGIKRGLVEPLEDVVDVLKKVEKEGDLGKLESSMEGAQDATEKLRKEIDDVNDQIRKTGKAGKDIGDGIKDGSDKAKQGIQEIGDESASTAKEAAASFDGSAASIGDAFQEVAANAFAGFGPVGLAAGVAAAAGIGLAIAQIDAAGESAEVVKEKVASLTEEFIATGLAATSNEYAVEYLKELATATDEGATSLNELGEKAGIADYALKDFTDALVGTEEQQRSVWRELDTAAEKTEKLWRETVKAEGENSKNAQALEDQLEAQRGLRDQMGQAIGVTADATTATSLYTEVSAERTAALEAEEAAEEATTEAVRLAEEARAAAATALQTGLDESVAAFEGYHDAESGTYDPAAYIEGMRLRTEATTNFNANVQTISEQFGLTNEETQAILDLGLDFAPMLQSIIDSGLAPEFIGQLQSAVGGGQDILNGSDLNATVSVTADEAPAEKSIRVVEERDRKAQIKLTTETRAADQQLDAVAEPRTAVITARASVGNADEILDRAARNRALTYTVTFKDQYGRKLN